MELDKLREIHSYSAEDFMKRFSKDGVSRKLLTIPDVTRPDLFRERIAFAYQSLSEIIDDQIRLVEQKTDFFRTCSINCASCCYHAIYITNDETDVIAYWIQHHFSSRSINNLKRTIKSWFAMFYKAGFTKNYDDSEEFKQRYFSAHIPCPFLTETKTCSIYPVRPSVCRTYFSYAEPRLCSKDVFVEFTYDGDPWRHALLILIILLHESITNDPSLVDAHLDNPPALLPIAIKQRMS